MGKTTMAEVRRINRLFEERLTDNMVRLTQCKRRPLFIAILNVLYPVSS